MLYYFNSLLKAFIDVSIPGIHRGTLAQLTFHQFNAWIPKTLLWILHN